MSLKQHYEKFGEELAIITHIEKMAGHWNQSIKLGQFGLTLGLLPKHLAKIQLILAEIYIRRAQWANARELLDQARTIAQNMDNKMMLATIHYLQGEIQYYHSFMMHEGDYQAALEEHNLALSLREQIGDKKGITHSLSRIGVIHERLGDHETAKSCYDRAVQISDEIDYPLGSERAITHLAARFEREGNLEQALHYHNKAMDITDNGVDFESTVFSLVNIGYTQFCIDGDSEKYKNTLTKALDYAKELGQKVAIGFFYYRFSQLYIQLKDKENALKYNKELVEFAKSVQFPKLVEWANEQLSTINTLES